MFPQPFAQLVLDLQMHPVFRRCIGKSFPPNFSAF